MEKNDTTEYFAELLETDAPVPKVIDHGGKTQTVYFRRISGSERVKLSRGQRVRVGESNTMDLDIGDLLVNRHQLVQYAAVKEDGTKIFRKIEDVQALPDWLVSRLAKAADEVNKDEDEAGKQ